MNSPPTWSWKATTFDPHQLWTPHQRVPQTPRLTHPTDYSSVDESLTIYTQTLFFLPTCRWNQATNFSHFQPLSVSLHKNSSTSKKTTVSIPTQWLSVQTLFNFYKNNGFPFDSVIIWRHKCRSLKDFSVYYFGLQCSHFQPIIQCS